MEATVVDSGRKALAELSAARKAREAFVLILADLHMPEMDGFALIEQIRQLPDLISPTIMMLSSSGHRGDAARCEELEVAAYLLKPIRQSEVRQAIAKALGAQDQKAPLPLSTRSSLQDENGQPLSWRVLLPEDNRVNQTFASSLLENS